MHEKHDAYLVKRKYLAVSGIKKSDKSFNLEGVRKWLINVTYGFVETAL